MKGFGKFLIVVGILAVCLGIVGFVILSSSGIGAEMADASISLGNAFGITSALSAGEQLQLTLVQYRTTLLIAGAVAFVIGLLMVKSGKRAD